VRNLIAFLLRFQGVMLFVLLEVVSLFLFVTNSSYQRAAFFNSANAYAGAVLARRTQIADYFRLDELNRQLLADNAQLRQQLYPPDFTRREADSLPVGRDTLGHIIYRHLRPDPSQALAAKAGAPGITQNAKLKTQNPRPDTLLLGGAKLATHDVEYPLVAARVLNNSLRAVDNYLTLNVGTADGVQPGLGVLSAAGVVGQVKSASAHYATVFSLLHSKMAVAAKLKRDGTFGSVKWPGDDFSHALLDYIPRQNRLVRGDTVVTSGYNAVFPEGVFVGTVESFVKEPDKNFWTVRLRLGVDFSRLTYVYVVHNRPRTERDSLETALTAPEPVPVKPPAKQPIRPNQ
jgi:rod shape-determining protein MreC